MKPIDIRQGDEVKIGRSWVRALTNPIVSEKWSPGRVHFLMQRPDMVTKVSFDAASTVSVRRGKKE